MNSIGFYASTVIISTAFAFLSQKFGYFQNNKFKINKVFWILSGMTLVLTLGLRTPDIGVDGENYLRIYNNINSMSVIDYYSRFTTEPLYYLLNRVVFLTFNNFSYVFFISSFVTILLFYKSFEQISDKVSLGLVVFLFSTTQYFYFFGIIRLGIAVSIVVYSYKYIIDKNPKKYIQFVMIATGFHFSALFALVLLLLMKPIQDLGQSKQMWILKPIIILILGFFFVRFGLYPFLKMTKYRSYIDTTISVNFNIINRLPILLTAWVFRKQLFANSKVTKFYYILFLLEVATYIFSPIIGISRVIWYLSISKCILLPMIYSISKIKLNKILILSFIILYSISYSYAAYFSESGRGNTMIPYRSIIFEFEK